MSRVIAAYAGMVAIWGTTWLVIRVALAYAPPLFGVGVRFLIAGIFLYGVAALRRKPLRTTAPWQLVIILAACLFGINYVLTYLAETRIPSGLVAVLFGTLPFFVFACSAIMLGEKISARIAGGALLALLGVAIISSATPSNAYLYELAAITAAALAAFGNVALKRDAHHEPLTTLAPAMLCAGVSIAFGSLVAREPVDLTRALQPQSLAAIGYLAIFGSGIAFWLNAFVLQKLSASIVGLSALMIPVVAVCVGAFAGERFGLAQLAGAGIVVAGMALALVRSRP